MKDNLELEKFLNNLNQNVDSWKFWNEILKPNKYFWRFQDDENIFPRFVGKFKMIFYGSWIQEITQNSLKIYQKIFKIVEKNLKTLKAIVFNLKALFEYSQEAQENYIYASIKTEKQT